MKLSTLLKNTGILIPRGMDSLDVTGITCDSRSVTNGMLFIAISGFETDGHLYISQAIDKGASAVISEKSTDRKGCILVNPESDNRILLAETAARFYGEPWNKLITVGVTGTNGKTSSAHMIKCILDDCGLNSGLLGTVGHIVAGKDVKARLTTPDALQISELMAKMVSGDDKACIMEVSSHSLSLFRVENVRFDATLFTNITQDHLDYHRTMEAYLNCKMHIFDLLKEGGNAIIGSYAPGFPELPDAVYFGMRQVDDYRISNIEIGLKQSVFTLIHKDKAVEVALNIPGTVNVYNAAGAIAVCNILGCDMSDAASSLFGFAGVPGRLEVVDEGQEFLVAVDYAHTPDALRCVIEQARESSDGKVIVVFGAGGDRDPLKRPVMGKIACDNADIVIVTSDNPRTENPDLIIANILDGIQDRRNVIVEPDRGTAINIAIKTAVFGDAVIIAGKGHEDYQILGTEKIHFDDREEARKVLKELQS